MWERVHELLWRVRDVREVTCSEPCPPPPAMQVELWPAFHIHHQEALGQSVLGYLRNGRKKVVALGRARPKVKKTRVKWGFNF